MIEYYSLKSPLKTLSLKWEKFKMDSELMEKDTNTLL
jgi:hypothetical protein